MAKKATPVEVCLFCAQHPCVCATTTREKQIRKSMSEGQEADDARPE
jgi:hypothetical protein